MIVLDEKVIFPYKLPNALSPLVMMLIKAKDVIEGFC